MKVQPKLKRFLQRLDFRRYLIAKFFIIFVASAFLLIGLARFGLRTAIGSTLSREGLFLHIKNYVMLLEEKVDSSPDPAESLRRFEENFDLRVRRDRLPNATQGQTFGMELPSQAEIKAFEQRRVTGGIGFGTYSGNEDLFFVSVPTETNRWIFFANKAVSLNSGIFMVIIFLVSAVLSVTFIATQQVLRPLKSLEDALEEFGQGNYKERAPVRGKDDIARVTISFNRMAERIESEMETREKLLADVSHEIRSPLTRLRLAAEMIADSQERTTIIEEVSDLAELTGKLLESYRYSGGNFAPLTAVKASKLFEVIEELAQIEKVAVLLKQEHSIAEQTLLLPENWNVLWNEDLCRSVIRNLLENVRRHATNRQAVVVSFHSNFVTIDDFGPRPSEEEIAKLREPFYRPDPSRSRKTGGHGLGLHLSKRLMLAARGSLEIRPNTQGGLAIALGFATEQGSAGASFGRSSITAALLKERVQNRR